MIPLLISRIDNFIYKAQREHKPLQAFKRTQSFTDLRSAFVTGIIKQADAAVELLPELLPTGLDPLTEAQIGKLNLELSRKLPPISQFVSEADVKSALEASFVWGVKAFYERVGIRVKASDSISFDLTNEYYLAELTSQAHYLLTKSGLDDTTLNRLVSIITEGKQDALTNDEIAAQITDEFPDIADYRADMIVRTEVARAMSDGDLAAMKENGVATKSWVTAGTNPCAFCENNEGDGEIGIHEAFSSGDDAPPGHPNCECYLMQGEVDLSLPELVLWGGE